MSLAIITSAIKRAQYKSDKGATAVEYALIVGLIAVVIITAVALLGTGLSNTFRDVACNVTSAGAKEWNPETKLCETKTP